MTHELLDSPLDCKLVRRNIDMEQLDEAFVATSTIDIDLLQLI